MDHRDVELQVFCHNIRTLRARNHLTQKEMALLLGIGVKSLSMLEHDVIPTKLKVDVLYKVYVHFGITPNIQLSIRL